MNQTAIAAKRVFICGSALRGQPDNSNLGDAKFIKEAKTRPIYRLHSAENGAHPAIYEVTSGGVSIPGEVYELTAEQFERLVAGEPPHMYPSDIILEGGEILTAFLYPRELVDQYQWEDISDRGGWAAYKQSIVNS
jgi:gamma-glutamylaminecyclotransferase